jgi:hypothetical protein
MLTGAEVHAQVEALVANEGGGRYVGLWWATYVES